MCSSFTFSQQARIQWQYCWNVTPAKFNRKKKIYWKTLGRLRVWLGKADNQPQAKGRYPARQGRMSQSQGRVRPVSYLCPSSSSSPCPGQMTSEAGNNFLNVPASLCGEQLAGCWGAGRGSSLSFWPPLTDVPPSLPLLQLQKPSPKLSLFSFFFF